MYGRSREGASALFIQLWFELLFDEYTCFLSSWKTIWLNSIIISALAFKICWGEVRAIKRSCLCFLYPVTFRITIYCTYLMLVLGGNDVTELFTECKDCLEKSVGGKYGQSREGASALFIQLCWELLSNEHILCLSSWKVIWLNSLRISALAFGCVGGNFKRSTEAMSVLFVQLRLELPSNEHIPCLTSLELIELNCCWMSALALKNLLEGNPSDQLQEKLQLFSLCSNV